MAKVHHLMLGHYWNRFTCFNAKRKHICNNLSSAAALPETLLPL